MKGPELRKLIKEFEMLYEEAEYALHMAHTSKDEEEKDEWENESEWIEYRLIEISDKVKNAEISRYCKKKYELEIQDIINNY
jgi:hypothetical protein